MLRCRPSPGLLPRCSTEQEWFHLTLQLRVQSMRLPTHSLPQVVPSRAAGFFPLLALLEAKLLLPPRSVLLGGGPMASSSRDPQPGSRGAPGRPCKAFRVCHRCWRLAGFSGGFWAGEAATTLGTL